MQSCTGSLLIEVDGAIADLGASFGNGNEFQCPSERRGFGRFVAENPLQLLDRWRLCVALQV